MKLLTQLTKPILTATALLAGVTGVAQASGHFIAGLQGQYPAYDLNDSYVFESSNKGYTSFILSSNPSAPGTAKQTSKTTFGEGGLYNLHIASDEKFKAGFTLVLSFSEGRASIGKIDNPNADIGSVGKPIGTAKIGKAITLENGIRLWAGRGSEPFFGNGVGLAKFNAAKQQGRFAPELFKEDGDLFAQATASFVVVDIPNDQLGESVKFFTTTAVNHKNEWSQVDRHANVLFPYVFLSDTPAVHEDHGQHRPNLDVAERRQAIVHNVFWATIVAGSKPAAARKHANMVADRIMPDVLSYDVGSKANYGLEKLNGRALHDDAMNTALELMTGVEIDDNAYDGKRYSQMFPYIIQK